MNLKPADLRPGRVTGGSRPPDHPPKFKTYAEYQYGARTRATSTRRCQDPRRIVGGKGGRARTSDPAPDARSGRDMASRLRSGSVLSRYVKYERDSLPHALERPPGSQGKWMPLERAEGLSRSGALRYRLTPCPGPAAARGARAQRGRGRRSRPSTDQPPHTELFRPRRCIVYRHIMSALDTGHDHDPSAARTQMFYV